MLNYALLKNPFNWIIITLMLVLAGIAASLICEHFTTNEAE